MALQDLAVFRNGFTTIISVKRIVETKHIEISFVRLKKKLYFCTVNKTNSIQTMRTYLINTIGQIPTTNRQLDYKSTFKTNEWVVFNDKQGEVEKLLFLDGDKLLVSLNGKTSYSKWQYMKVNSSLVIDDGDNKYMFKIIFCNKDIILLNVDSTDNYSFLINTKSEALEGCNYKEIQWYLKKRCNVDIFNKEQRIEYENVQRKLKLKEDEKKREDMKRARIKLAIIIGLILIIAIVSILVG